MEKKTECMIVQDLLLGYVDDVLNEESKKVVEKHLAECDVCQKRLKDINNSEIEVYSCGIYAENGDGSTYNAINSASTN